MGSTLNPAILKSRQRWINFFNNLFMNSNEIWNLYSITSRTILALNPRAISISGYSSEELKVTPIERIYPENELMKLGALLQNLTSTFVAHDDVTFYTKSGSLKRVTVHASLLSHEPEELCLVKTTERD